MAVVTTTATRRSLTCIGSPNRAANRRSSGTSSPAPSGMVAIVRPGSARSADAGLSSSVNQRRYPSMPSPSPADVRRQPDDLSARIPPVLAHSDFDDQFGHLAGFQRAPERQRRVVLGRGFDALVRQHGFGHGRGDQRRRNHVHPHAVGGFLL